MNSPPDEVIEELGISLANHHLDVFKQFSYAWSAYELIFRIAAGNGHLNTLKWIFDNMHMHPNEIQSFSFQAFCLAAEHNHLHVLKWLSSYYDFSSKHTKELGTIALNRATENGHTEVMDWLTKTFEL